MTQGIVALVFRCTISGGALTANGEARDFQWLTRVALEQLMHDQEVSEAFAERLLDAFRGDQTPVIREHDGTTLLR